MFFLIKSHFGFSYNFHFIKQTIYMLHYPQMSVFSLIKLLLFSCINFLETEHKKNTTPSLLIQVAKVEQNE